jgi:ubiquinone/menaquinone biosynthesis C-methylase UbiE
MQLTPDQIANIQKFIQKTRTEIYPEPPSDVHTRLTKKMMNYCLDKITLPAEALVLDVGCGQGVALEFFKQKGYQTIGVTLGEEDIEACREKGYQVYEMDQSFLEFPDQTFDFIWCRHCLEHSIFPYYTLFEFSRVLKPQGYLYVEVPAPDTIATHQTNPNHYSVLGKTMWSQLMKRSGFSVLDVVDIQFPLKVRNRQTGKISEGVDTYWAFINKKGNS